MIAIMLAIHTNHIIVAIPYRSIDFGTEIYEFVTIQVTDSGTFFRTEKDTCLIWRKRCTNIVLFTVRFKNNFLSIAIEIEIKILIIYAKFCIRCHLHISSILRCEISNCLCVCKAWKITFAQLHIAEYTDLSTCH